MPKSHDELAQFRKMLDPRNWPIEPGEYLIIQGEIVAFIKSGDPDEERTYKPLFRGRFQ